MIQFNELRISPNNDYIIIDVSIEDSEYYQNILLDSIHIDTQDTYVENGPSANPIFSYQIPEDYNSIYTIPDNEGNEPVQEEPSEEEHIENFIYTIDNYSKKRVRLLLKSKNLETSIADKMFFVYVKTTGEYSEDTPAEFRNTPTMGTIVNLYPIYRQAMAFTKEIGNNCTVPKHFIDYIIKVKALDLSIKTGNYTEAIRYWNKLFKNIRYKTTEDNCGCYG